MGLFRDFSNFRYVQARFDLILENEVLQKQYKLQRTPLGVLYTLRPFPVGTPDDYMDQLLVGDLALLDQALSVMNLDGIVAMEYREVGADEDNRFYLIKFIPLWQTSPWGIVFRLVATGALLWTGWHYRAPLEHHLTHFIDWARAWWGSR